MNSNRKYRPQFRALNLDFPKNVYTGTGALLTYSQQLAHDFQHQPFFYKSAKFKNHGPRLHDAFNFKLYRPYPVGLSKVNNTANLIISSHLEKYLQLSTYTAYFKYMYVVLYL